MITTFVQLKPIDELTFQTWPSSRKLIVHDHARRFATVSVGAALDSFALSWYSDLVDPVLAAGPKQETWIGVDQRIACVTHDGRVVVSLGLATPVVLIRCFAEKTVVLTETEAIAFNISFSIAAIQDLPDIPEDLLEEDNDLVVVSLGSRERTVLKHLRVSSTTQN